MQFLLPFPVEEDREEPVPRIPSGALEAEAGHKLDFERSYPELTLISKWGCLERTSRQPFQVKKSDLRSRF